MSRLAQFSNRWWLGGSALAAVGVILVRQAAPALASSARSWTQLGGELIALSGLLVIAWGISRRVRSVPPD